MRIKNQIKQDLPGMILAFCLMVVVGLTVCVQISEYLNVSETCNGVIVRDYMGMPACVPANTVAVPLR